MEELDQVKYDGSEEDCRRYGRAIVRHYREEGQEPPREALQYSFRKYKEVAGTANFEQMFAEA